MKPHLIIVLLAIIAFSNDSFYTQTKDEKVIHHKEG